MFQAKHVINYDFPHFISDYIHRAGRIGRVGSSGTGFVLSCVSYKWDVDLLWKIEVSRALYAVKVSKMKISLISLLTMIYLSIYVP